MKTIKITLRRTYTKTATVEIPFPDDIHNLDETTEYLYDNQDLYHEEIERKLLEAEYDVDLEFDNRRYDVEERIVLSKKVWGGSL